MALAAPETPFLWGAGGSMKTPEQVARDREIAAALMQGGMDFSPVDHWLQGAARAAQGGVGALKDVWANEAETAGRDGYKQQWDSVFGGASPQVASIDPVAQALTGTPQTANDATAAMAAVPSGNTAEYIRSGLLSRGLPEHVADGFLMNFQDESGFDPSINEAAPTVPGSRGGYGLYQLTGPRRVAYEQYAQQQGVDPSNVDAQLDFMMSELAGPEASAYQAIMAAPDTGSAAAAIVNKFLRPAEQHRAARVAEYTGGGVDPVAQALMGSGGGQGGGAPSMQQLMGLASDPWANDTQKSIVQSLLGQQMQRQDPMYQLQMQAAQQGLTKGDLEIAQLLNPAPQKPIEVNGRLVNPANGEVIADYSDPNTATVGNAVIDVSTGLPIYEGQPDPTSNMQDYEAYAADERAAGREPIGRLAYEQEVRKSGASNINVGGTSQTPGDDKFYETLGTESGKRFSAMIQQGADARRNLSQLDVASDLLDTAPQGPMGVATLLAGKLGVDLGGLNETQALNAVIEQMVPAQREPGAGPMSDKDIEMYRGSVVSLSNMPGGNKLIIDTARAINQYDMQIADIAGKVEDGVLTRAQAREEMAKVPNPIDGFREARKQLEGAGSDATPPMSQQPALGQSQAPTVTTQQEYDALPSGAPYKAPDGTIRTKR